jgi:hypothetical protein
MAETEDDLITVERAGRITDTCICRRARRQTKLPEAIRRSGLAPRGEVR